MNDLIRQHKRMAEGEDIMSEYSCESPFTNGQSHDDGAGKKRALKDGSRSHDGKIRHPDHGPHDMNVPMPRTD